MDPEEEHFIDIGQLRDDLEQCLHSTERTGSFAHYGHLEQYPNPGLDISGLGSIGLPLSERDATALKDLCHKAPFGKGTETLVDTSVRDTWEINGSEINFTNPKWNHWIQNTVVPNVAEHLGVEKSALKHTKAELYKLLLYEEGAHFKPHQDSEKAPRMYATLVVCLPSAHRGGEVILKHGDETKSYSSALWSSVDLSYAAWYADVTHEVATVTSGNRLVLTYNLIDQSPSSDLLSASAVGAADAKLQRILERWDQGLLRSDEDEPINYLSFVLDHEYTHASLCFDLLKGQDKRIVSHAARIGAQTGFRILLGTLEKMRSGGVDDYGYYGGGGSHEIIDECDSHLKLKNVVDLEGKPIVTDVDILDESIIPTDYFEDMDPDDEEFGGYIGNEGAETTLWYRTTAMVIVPSKNFLELKLGPTLQHAGDVQSVAMQYHNAFLQDDENPTTRIDLFGVCSLTLFHAAQLDVRRKYNYSYKAFSDNSIGYIAVCSVSLGDIGMTQRALNALQSSLPLSMFTDLGLHMPQEQYPNFQETLAKALHQIKSLSAKNQAIGNLRSGFAQQKFTTEEARRRFLQDFDDYSRGIIKMSLETGYFNPDDAEALVHLVATGGNDMLFRHVIPYVRKYIKATPFSVEVLAGLISQVYKSVDTCPNFVEQIVEVVNAMLQTFKVATFGTHPLSTPYGWVTYTENSIAHNKGNSILSHVDPGAAARLYGQLLRMGQESFAKTLLHHIECDVRLEAKDFGILYELVLLPFLREMFEIHDSLDIPLSSDLCERYVRAFQSYNSQWVQPQPTKPSTWGLEPIDCDCADCRGVNEFLISQQRQHQVRATEKRRDHVQCKLYRHPVAKATKRNQRAPHTLVLTKTGNDYDGRLRRWKQRVQQARTMFKTFPQDRLRAALGDDFDRLTLNGHTNIQAVREPLQEMPQAGVVATSNTATSKRKAKDEGDKRSPKRTAVDLVDLTAD